MKPTPADEQLLSLLRENARLSTAEIARRLKLSRTTVHSRIERLERVTEHITSELAGSLSERPELESWVDDRIDYRISRTRGAIRRRPETRGADRAPRADSSEG